MMSEHTSLILLAIWGGRGEGEGRTRMPTHPVSVAILIQLPAAAAYFEVCYSVESILC